MSVMMISEVSGQSLEGYEGMLAVVSDALKQAPGFVIHASHPIDGGWRILEVWNSQQDAAKFFASYIVPKLPDGIRPKLKFQPLHDVLQP